MYILCTETAQRIAFNESDQRNFMFSWIHNSVVYFFHACVSFSDFEDSDSKKNDEYMNVSEKSRWSVVCDTIEEWVNFAEKFKTSKSKNELNLFKIIQENFLPTLNKIYEEKVCWL